MVLLPFTIKLYHHLQPPTSCLVGCSLKDRPRPHILWKSIDITWRSIDCLPSRTLPPRTSALSSMSPPSICRSQSPSRPLRDLGLLPLSWIVYASISCILVCHVYILFTAYHISCLSVPLQSSVFKFVCVCLLCEVSVTPFPMHQFSRNHERLSHYSLPS